ncbi:Exported zinc metalloprotease YfgC precursor [Vibrio cholerae]|nr:Exported zinc metalloprotease YfgC precursor [Vibrio cholerae]
MTINYANVLLKQDKFTDAIRILQRYTHDNPNDINGWQLLSEANSRLGNSAEDLAARGEIMALQANWNKAIQFYTQASQLVELGSLAQARYDARIDQLMVQRERFLSLQ